MHDAWHARFFRRFVRARPGATSETTDNGRRRRETVGGQMWRTRNVINGEHRNVTDHYESARAIITNDSDERRPRYNGNIYSGRTIPVTITITPLTAF